MSSLNVPKSPTWTFSRNAPIIRFYRLVYLGDFPFSSTYEDDKVNASLSKLTFCRLFWGVVCSPLIVLLIIGLSPLIALAVLIDWAAHRQRTADKAREAAAKVPEHVGGFFDRLVAFFQRHSGLVRVLVVGLWSLMAAVPLALLALLGHVIDRHYLGLLTGLTFTGWGLLVIVGAAAVAVVVGFLLAKTPVGTACEWARRTVWSALCAFGRPCRSVFRFLVAGHHAVKYRTCPLIKIVDGQ